MINLKHYTVTTRRKNVLIARHKLRKDDSAYDIFPISYAPKTSYQLQLRGVQVEELTPQIKDEIRKFIEWYNNNLIWLLLEIEPEIINCQSLPDLRIEEKKFSTQKKIILNMRNHNLNYYYLHSLSNDENLKQQEKLKEDLKEDLLINLLDIKFGYEESDEEDEEDYELLAEAIEMASEHTEKHKLILSDKEKEFDNLIEEFKFKILNQENSITE